MRKLKVIMISILLLTVVGCNKEEESYKRVEYSDIEDIVYQITNNYIEIEEDGRTKHKYDYAKLNDIVYTINEDSLEEEYKEYLFENGSEIRRDFFGRSYLAYYLIDQEEYCDREKIEKDGVCRTTNKGASISVKGYSQFPVVVIVEKIEEKVNYVVEFKETKPFMEAIDNAYIISTIEDIDNLTEEQREALDWSYEVALKSDPGLSKDIFEQEYKRKISRYKEYLAELNDMNAEEIADNYEKYQVALEEIDDNLKIINPPNEDE